MTRSRFNIVVTVAGAALAVGGCGGDSGVASPGAVATPQAPVPVPVPVPAPAPVATALTPADLVQSPRPAQRSANDSAEYRTNYTASELIRALYAADAGITGQGVTVGIVDGGFVPSGPDLAGHTSPLSRDFGNLLTKNPDGSYASVPRNDIASNPGDPHGSLVAELLAASRNDTGSVGVAPGAMLAYLRVDDDKLLEPKADGTVNSSLSGRNIAAAISYAASVKLPVLSVSLGIDGGASPTITGAIDRFAASGGLFVIAAGNNGGTDPESIQLLSAANRANWLSVGGLSTTITSVFALDPGSNKAGVLADRYIVAPYANVASDPSGNGFFRFTGTSGSVPLVAGAAALVLQKWPQLTGKQAGDVLLATALDIGAAGVDPIFGHGLLDIRAALSPVNPTLVTKTGTITPVAAASLALPAAFGTGQITRLMASTVILDQFGRDFTADTRGLVTRPTTLGSVTALTRPLRHTVSGTAGFNVSSTIEYTGGPVRDGEPVARLAGTAIRVRAGGATVEFTQGYAPWSGGAVAGLGAPGTALAAYAGAVATGLRTSMPFGHGALTFDAGTGGARARRTVGASQINVAGLGWSDGRWSLGGGVVSETGSLFGARSTGPLRLGSGASTGFAEARYVRAAGRWLFSSYGSLGVTAVRGLTDSLLTAPSTLVTSRFGVEAARQAGPARLTFGIAQPLNVESGAATLTLANGYSLASRSLTFGAHQVDLRGDRQLLAQAGVDVGGLRIGVVQGMLRRDTGVVTSVGWRF